MVKNLFRTSRRNHSITGTVKNPELVFGIVGPIGVNIDAVMDALSKSLSEVQYIVEPIHLTDLIRSRRIRKKLDFSSYYSRYQSLIAYANEFRRLAGDAAALAGVAIFRIRQLRSQATKKADVPALGKAYIIRQFKRAEEIALMRSVYGRKFIQVSVFGSAQDRRSVLINKIQHHDSSPKTDAECERQAIDLINIDHNQKDEEHGQRLSEAFHLGDVFVDGIDPAKAEKTINRFIKALFGSNSESPSKDEYGLYIAAAASLRSVDLSRQVGAAIFTSTAEIISMGCNEVPKAGGGTYWSDDRPPIFRDVELGYDTNQERKSEIIFDLVNRLSEKRFLSQKLLRLKNTQKRMETLLQEPTIKDSQAMDIIEFGRMIHAEMSAISDAARLGRSTKGATLFCTTFPCHLCAKHIVAAGIDRVVFLEPYPKSYAQKLHQDSITYETDGGGKVLFQPFIGISPRRYRDIFEKKGRKNGKGKAKEWYEDAPVPLIEDRSASYIENEEPAAVIALRQMLKSERPRSKLKTHSTRKK